MKVLTNEMIDALVEMGADIDAEMRGALLRKYGEGSSWSRMESLGRAEACPNHGLPDDVAYVDCGNCGVGECWPWGLGLIEEACSELWPDASQAIHGIKVHSRDSEGELEIPF